MDESTTRRGTDTPVHRPEKPAGYKHSSTSGLSPREQLERQVEFHSSTTFPKPLRPRAHHWGTAKTSPRLQALPGGGLRPLGPGRAPRPASGSEGLETASESRSRAYWELPNLRPEDLADLPVHPPSPGQVGLRERCGPSFSYSNRCTVLLSLGSRASPAY